MIKNPPKWERRWPFADEIAFWQIPEDEIANACAYELERFAGSDTPPWLALPRTPVATLDKTELTFDSCELTFDSTLVFDAQKQLPPIIALDGYATASEAVQAKAGIDGAAWHELRFAINPDAPMKDVLQAIESVLSNKGSSKRRSDDRKILRSLVVLRLRRWAFDRATRKAVYRHFAGLEHWREAFAPLLQPGDLAAVEDGFIKALRRKI